jgi:uncharacterized protein (DUF302 family)
MARDTLGRDARQHVDAVPRTGKESKMTRFNVGKLMAIVAVFGLAPLQALANPPAQQMPQLFIESTSGKGLQETLAAFEDEVKAASWSILHVHHMDRVLKAKGYDMQPVAIYEVCSGKYSAKILTNDADRYVSSLIPCRVAIYQTTKGEVIISRMNTAVMSAMLTPSVAEVVQASAGDMEAIIAKVLAKPSVAKAR